MSCCWSLFGLLGKNDFDAIPEGLSHTIQELRNFQPNPLMRLATLLASLLCAALLLGETDAGKASDGVKINTETRRFVDEYGRERVFRGGIRQDHLLSHTNARAHASLNR